MRKLSVIMTLALGLAGLAGAGLAFADNKTNATEAAPGLTEWTLDPGHTHIGFSVPHMVVSEVEGQFKNFSGKVLLDEKDLTKSQLEFKVLVASLDTNNVDRDKHVIGPDFFDAPKFPEITFKSNRISKSSKGYKIAGELTVHGVTKPVTLDATLSDAVTSPWGKQVRACRLRGSVSRSDFGMVWNKSLDKGGVLVGDTVTLDLKLEINK
jgi:polyisoprenoid-binding protein YceI